VRVSQGIERIYLKETLDGSSIGKNDIREREWECSMVNRELPYMDNRCEFGNV
jgi:hypothetical protein